MRPRAARHVPSFFSPFPRHGRLSAYDDYAAKAGSWFALTSITGDDSDLRERVEVDLPRRAVGGDVAEPILGHRVQRENGSKDRRECDRCQGGTGGASPVEQPCKAECGE